MVSNPPESIGSTADHDEIDRFAAQSGDWWNTSGAFAPLHRLNPVRLDYIRSEFLAHFGRDERALRPFAGLSLVDIGCGGGLIAEPMARLGFEVVAIDAAPEAIEVARAHAEASGLAIDYRAATAEALAAAARRFDAVLALEIVEHVADRDAFFAALGRLVKPGGALIGATLNRTFRSFALAIVGAEYVLNWLPRGTHDWNRFLAPTELRAKLEDSGLSILKTQGVSFDPLGWDWKLSSDTDVNYMVVAGRP